MDISNVILSSNYGLPSPLNAQTVLEKAALHLVHQGRRSLLDDGYGGCAYRGVNSTACAVGALIPDRAYDEGMEGCTAGQLIVQFMPELEPFFALLSDLQDLHDLKARAGTKYDDAIDKYALLEGLRQIAFNHGLSADFLDTPYAAQSAASIAPAEITSLLRPSLAKTEA